jgi:hypothetical protein
MPHLTKPQATVLALWSFAIACTRSSGRTTVATFLALLLGRKLANLEQRLYEWCLSAKDKAGKKHTSLDVTLCFVPLLGWIVRLVACSGMSYQQCAMAERGSNQKTTRTSLVTAYNVYSSAVWQSGSGMAAHMR